jgi:D-sedoheptulose 7-phosphate isomerase
MRDLTAKVRAAAEETARTQQAFFDAHAERVVACARDLATAFDRGGRLYTFGNGGSACDAQHAAVEFSHPVFEKRAAIPAIALPCDVAHLTAVGNDRDFAGVFAAALRVHARQGDIALALSTSGQSASVLRGIAAAKEIGMLVVGLAGRDGGRMSSHPACDHLFVVDSFSIHRIQETHETFLHVLWDLVHVVRGAEDVLS